MSPTVAYRPRARLDLLEQFLYLVEEAQCGSGRALLRGHRYDLCPTRKATALWNFVRFPESPASKACAVRRFPAIPHISSSTCLVPEELMLCVCSTERGTSNTCSQPSKT